MVNNNNLRNLASSAISTILCGLLFQSLIVRGAKLNLNILVRASSIVHVLSFWPALMIHPGAGLRCYLIPF